MEQEGPAPLNIEEVNNGLPPGDHGDGAADSLPQQVLPVSNVVHRAQRMLEKTPPGAIEEEFQVRI